MERRGAFVSREAWSIRNHCRWQRCVNAARQCRAGLQEADELLSINEQPCGTLSHAQAMDLIDSSSGILHIRVKRVPAGFQSVVLVTRAPSPRIDKEYRAALRAMSPNHSHHAPVREIHRSHSSITSGLTSPPGSEAYYGETDSDADVAGFERQRRQKRRSPSNSNPGKPTGRASPEGGETSEMSGYDSAPDAHGYPRLLDGSGGDGDRGGGLLGVARREVIYQAPAPGMWSSQTSTETSSIISSADDQGPRDGGQEEDSGFLEIANVPLVSPERAKEALLLGSRNQLVPMVGPVNTPIDEELTTTYMEKAKQAKLNRGDTQQDKHVKEAKSKCRTIASLLTDAPNPHSKGVLMFKKRRQRSKKYTLTSFGSVDEDRCQDSQEEDGAFPGSESEFDEDGFSAVPDPTWDSDYLDMLEKRATAGTEGRGDGAEDAPSQGLSNTTGKGAQLFEQQRKRAAEHAKKVEAAQPQAPPQFQVQGQAQMYQLHPEIQPQMQPNLQPQQMIVSDPRAIQQEQSQAQGQVAAYGMSNGDLSYSAVSTASMMMSPPPVAPRLATASVTVLNRPAPPAETPLPELPASNVLNRTARPFTPGFISIRAATAPVAFRPSISNMSQRPASAAVMPSTFSTASELAMTSVTSQLPPGQPSVFSPPSFVHQGPLALTPEGPTSFNPPVASTYVEKLQSSPPITAVYQAPFVAVPPVYMPSMPMAPQAPMVPAPAPPVYQIPGSPNPVASVPPLQVPVAQPRPSHFPMVPVATVSVVSQPEIVAPTPFLGPTGRTGILLDSRRRGVKPKPMFNVPDIKKYSPNPDLLCMVQNLDDRSTRHKYGQLPSEDIYDEAEERSGEAGMGRAPPPVAPKPRVIHEAPQILQAGGKGAQLFARRQSRMGMYVVDTPPETPYQQEVASHSVSQPLDSFNNPYPLSQWKYSPNVRAPPPIGYNPLVAPSIPMGPQRNTGKPESMGRGGSQREGIKALDFMRRQPYQLNSAMFNYGGSVANLSAMPSYQVQRQQQGDYTTTTMVGSSLTSPKQIPIKTARVFEVKRFSTPTPMSAPSLAPMVIAPRSATSLGERLTYSGMISPPAAPFTPTLATLLTPAPVSAATSASHPSQPAGLPGLPKFSATPIPHHVPPAVPTPYTPVSYTTGLQGAKQFQSAPELSFLASLPPIKSDPVQAPKPRFVATKGGVQPHVWRPGAISPALSPGSLLLCLVFISLSLLPGLQQKSVMPLGKPAMLNKRKKLTKIITDLSHIPQDEYESEPEASEFDLGTKIRTPKDIMLEELSLQNNKGSKMFRRRQKRVERFIYENNPDIFSSESMDNLQKFVPALGGQMGSDMINVGGHFVSKQAGQLHYVGLNTKGGAPVPPPKPGSKGAGAGAGAGGLGGGDHGKGGQGEGEGHSEWSPLKGGGSDDVSKKLLLLKSYVSPWEKAMKGDQTLIATLKSGMPGPIDPKDMRKYKSFNRSAMPFGGFEKANQFMKFQLPETEAKQEPEPAVVYQHDIGCRPSFNRTPIGWVCSGEPDGIQMETDAVPFNGETDEL
ncbi:synaptopodin 2-like protein [Cottoperca gobio]|uniref:Synaptopodin 2-like protein n=1 Tax=Cottoperca gobio TaxID=56716 RepID=A0A6J2R5T2_COTGO|nr:synaptopodin 2-like protein [Cottoperca gobio]